MDEKIGWDPGKSHRGGINAILRLLRIEHTLFSLPFAYMGGLLSGKMTLREFIWITLAVFGLRSAAMAYNNLADLAIDRLNPRSRMRPLVVGTVSKQTAWLIVFIGSALYFLSAYMLNFYSFIMSPIPWIFAITYPYAKRWHSWPHIHLGFVLALVILGGSFGVLGDTSPDLLYLFARVPWCFMFAIIFWVAGFDIIYSIMDVEYDRRFGLGSVPSKYGIKNAVVIAIIFHIVMTLLMLAGAIIHGLGPLAYISIVAASTLTLYGDFSVSRSLEKIKMAFNLNLWVGLIISIGVIIDRYFEIYH